MGNRLSAIATRTGDTGSTGLGNNTRVGKDHVRIHALGEVDELNSHIGLLLCEDLPADIRALLVQVQHDLFDLGGELCMPGYSLLKDSALLDVNDRLEGHADEEVQSLAITASGTTWVCAHGSVLTGFVPS